MRVSDDPSAYPELSHLLAAATAPPRPAELAGRAAAVAAFEAAGRDGGTRVMPVRRRIGRRVAGKVVAAAALVLFGGSAVVAEAGRLPRGVQHAYEAFAGLGTPPSPTPGPPTVRTTPPPPPAVAAPGLCRAWRKKPAKKPPHALVALAGGVEHVAAYCDRVSPVEQSQSARPGKAKDKNRKKPHPKTVKDRPA
jgi:hypothetical protein